MDYFVLPLIESHEEHVHVFKRSAFLVQLGLQDRVVHQVYPCHPSNNHIRRMVPCVVPLVVDGSRSGSKISIGVAYNWLINNGIDVVERTASACHSILIKRVSLVDGRSSTNDLLVISLNHLVSNIGRNTPCVHCHLTLGYHTVVLLLHVVLDVLRIVELLLRLSCVFWATCSPPGTLATHVHLVLSRSGALRDHRAVGHSPIHLHLTVPIRVLLPRLWSLINKVSLWVLSVLKVLLDEGQVALNWLLHELALRISWYFLAAFQLVLLQHVLPVLHYDVLLVLVRVHFVSRVSSFLGAKRLTELWLRSLLLLLTTTPCNLGCWYVVHVCLVDVSSHPVTYAFLRISRRWILLLCHQLSLVHLLIENII